MSMIVKIKYNFQESVAKIMGGLTGATRNQIELIEKEQKTHTHTQQRINYKK